METSTPSSSRDEKGNKDLHGKTILQNAINASPFHRRSLVSAPIVSLEDVNDDQERSSRRSLMSMQKRLSTIPSRGFPLNDTYTFLSGEDMKDHFKLCTKLFTENKITKKNAWNLHVIDLLKHIAQRQDTDILQLAGTSLDISAKVYSIRVDDIHCEGLKLASSMSRVSNNERQPDLNETGGVAENPDKENAAAKRKEKKKRLHVDKKNTICKDPKTLQAPLPKLDSVFFSTRTDTTSCAIDNLFTNKLKLDSSGYKFMLLSNEKAWTEQPDPVIQALENPNRKKYPLTVDPLVNFKICKPFTGFELGEWDPNEEEEELALQKSTFIEKEQEVLFEEDGIPIHELDGSIHDLFENPSGDAEDHIQSVHEEVAPQVRGEIANIMEFTPTLTEGTVRSEYSYNPVITLPSGKLSDQIRAGPSHWKVKFNKRATAKFSGVITNCKKKAKSGKKKAPPKMMDYDSEVEDLDLTHKLKIRRKPSTMNAKKFTLPLLRYPPSKMMGYINELSVKKGVVCPVKKTPTVDNCAHFETSAYKYENPNDSQYCLQHSEDELGAGVNMPRPSSHIDGEDIEGVNMPGPSSRIDGEDIEGVNMPGPSSHIDGEDIEGVNMPGPSSHIDGEDIEEHRLAEQEFMGENLVDAPEMIPKVYVPYALKAKKMDMKKFKAAIWQNLTDTATSTVKNTQERDGKVIPTTFSKMYNKLPAHLPHEMQKMMSCPLAFVALLHLCNEENLSLVQHEGNKDFDISGP